MRHRKNKITLDRGAAHRGALLRNLATSLVLYDQIQTTEAKAKALRPFMERLVTLSKNPTLANRRKLIKALYTKGAVRKACDVLGPRYKDRKGGFLRITHLGTRRGDAARLAHISFVV
ncbi:50S ribosomal protein L17 [Candidatus Uhrbacteria bacterium RIFCSPLOWO2_02_FULL_49_11]|uniref:50S ribosomal protein L17 n=1 Tax=Candidatus Uhrbacteria bacterium RIFCSPLOWO2_02_FULL_49_11 TaxID=1802409 RepID=A0A1F7VAT8_9BACT|nr:MAG: 50S ribosomal protein L17 [Candidatus Uhrbacteria bacterium RIFCSPLOWO2_02_FULL_49_11]